MSSINISVVIPVYNGGEGFYRCLTSIGESLRPPDEVVVVSDGDTDGSWQVAKNFGATVLRLPKSEGPARARNIGAQTAQGDIIFFMDADVTLHSDTLSLVEQRFQAQSNLAALIGSYDDAPGAENFLSQYKNLFHHYTHQVSSEVAFTFWGACGAIRRSIFLAVGGFDEGYTKPCIEDIELGYRLKQMGYDIRLCKDIQIKHLKRWQPISLLRAEIFYRALPWAALILSEHRFEADLNLSHANRLSVVGVYSLIGTLLAGFFFPWLWGVTVVIALGLLLINANVYRFFYAKRGMLFTLRVIPWHWFYFFYGGGAFAYVLVQHSFRRFLRLPAPVMKVRRSR
ncbi:MAG: glycosyltransferase family 2 protein [Cyanobacteria bacterium P01_H01_bin.21]